jgi:hypothetical protein
MFRTIATTPLSAAALCLALLPLAGRSPALAAMATLAALLVAVNAWEARVGQPVRTAPKPSDLSRSPRNERRTT